MAEQKKTKGKTTGSKAGAKPKGAAKTKAKVTSPVNDGTPTEKETTKMLLTQNKFGDSIVDEIMLIILIVGAIVTIISLFSEKMGFVGGLLSSFLKGLFGFGAMILPFLIIFYCVWLLGSETKKDPGVRLVGAILFLLCTSAVAYVFHPDVVSVGMKLYARWGRLYSEGSFLNGGLFGGLIGGALLKAFGHLGSALILIAVLLISIIMGTGKSFFQGISMLFDYRKMRKGIHNEKIKYKAERIRQKEQMELERLEKKISSKKASKGDFNFEIQREDREQEVPLVEATFFNRRSMRTEVKKREPIYDYVKETADDEPMDEKRETTSEEPLEQPYEPIILSGSFAEEPQGEHMEEVDEYSLQGEKADEDSLQGEKADETRVEVPETTMEQQAPLTEEEEKEDQEEVVQEAPKEKVEEKKIGILEIKKAEKQKPYVFPPIHLLGIDKTTQSQGSKIEMLQNARKLEETLKSFGVDAKVIQINHGPTVTRYELSPSQGVKVSKIVNLADDIALNLAASGIRIEAPIPGKAAVGIEVPNRETQSVFLRSVLDTQEFKGFPSKLAFALGEDITGKTVVTDIGKMPHLLIAGATGSGKSVCINTLITSILYKADPKEVKLLLVDPKVVELSVYNGIPHLLIPVVTDPKKAAAALNWAVREMLERYNDFAEHNVRDIKGYNAMKREKGEEEGVMPQIVIIIDELADLMMAAPGEVEDSICRLAQMARAAGMHLIIATQRPSVDVITGVIKANIPSRLAFAVSSGIDSRTILDMVGAEKLLGKGDMLFYPTGMSKPVRIQGAFVTDKEVENIVAFVKEDGHANYDKEMIEKITATTKIGEAGEESDEYFDQAMELVVEKEKASVSMLQRQFRIGYNRAARLMDDLEQKGIVGQEDGSKPRKVLLTKTELVNMQEQTEE